MRRRPLNRMWPAVVVVALMSAACSQTARATVPECPIIGPTADDTEGLNSASWLMAQAVPSASLLPCIENLPPGWNFESLDVERDRARYRLSSDRMGIGFVAAQLTAACDPTGTEVDAEHEGVSLYQDATVVPASEEVDEDARYVGRWYYVFEGGCVEFIINGVGVEVVELDHRLRSATGFLRRVDLERLSRGVFGSDL